MKEPQILWPKKIPVLLTHRLRLRELKMLDMKDYFELNTHPLVMKMYGVHPHKTRKDTEKLIRYLDEEFRKKELLRWGIEDLISKKMIGDIGYWRFVPIRRRGELGAKLLPQYWKSGLMTEAMTAVLEYSFSRMGLHSVEGNIETKNVGSHKLVERLGFTKVGCIRSHSYNRREKKYVDTLLYSLTEEEWKRFH